MSLITCTECKKEVSSKAESCPHCGDIINMKDGKLVMFQITKKKWKMVRIVAWVLLIIGLIFYEKNNSLGSILVIFSVIAWFISKLGSWWTNG